MSGPYFEGQRPAECGHYYPDVLRVRDEMRTDTKFVRISDCAYCGRSEREFDIGSLAPQFTKKLRKKGVDIGIKESRIEKVREKHRKKFARKNKKK